jgi:hypothetical protein
MLTITTHVTVIAPVIKIHVVSINTYADPPLTHPIPSLVFAASGAYSIRVRFDGNIEDSDEAS